MIDFVQGISNPQSEIGGNLIIPTAARVQFSAHISQLLNERMFDVHMDIFQLRSIFELAGFNFQLNFFER